MSQVEKVSVALTPELAAAMRQAVADGDYASASEVVRDALRGWRLRRMERAEAVATLRASWDAGVASGEPLDGPATFEAIRRRLPTERR